ncbi:MAG TPA: insulinase family protein, partial [Tenericutes bacterium]|nr:insulinase family protein [Mycoplasmatota bacterium]
MLVSKKELEKLGVEVVEKVLDNNLRVFIVPMSNVSNIYVTFSTDFGSIHNEFVPIDEKKMIKVPDGIAHFLEHKVFEQENGIDPFTFFSERGADLNANTSYVKTTYLFSGIDFFEENIKYLIDFVTTPHFTDENIEKEKGIIEQEIKMYLDDPYTRLYEGILYNTFINHPMKYPIIGSIDSIRSITKEDLFKCYNTFYTTSNMFIVITGNVDPNKTIEILETIDFKNKSDNKKIKLKTYNEPDKVAKEKEILKLNVTIPKATITYKINIKNVKNISETN